MAEDETIATALRCQNWWHWQCSLGVDKLGFKTATNFARMSGSPAAMPVFDETDALAMEPILAVFRREWGREAFEILITRLAFDTPKPEQRFGLSVAQFNRQYRENLKAISWLTGRLQTP